MAISEIRQFMAAIRRLESGSYSGNYGAVGPDTGGPLGRALGAYQIMESNWTWWAQKWGMPGADWRSKEAQDWIAEKQFTEYYNEYGSWDLVAIAWFAGPGAANRARDEGLNSVSSRQDVLGTNVGQYVNLVMGYMDKAPDRYKDRSNRDRLLELEGLTEEDLERRPPDVPEPTGMTGVYGSPQFMLEQWLHQLGLTEEGQEVPPIRSPLAAMLDSISNAVAGGRRMALDAMGDEVPLLEPVRPQKQHDIDPAAGRPTPRERA